MTKKILSPGLKKKIAIEALREQSTANEIASNYEVNPAQVRKWKKELLDGAISIFEDPRKSKKKHKEQQEQEAILQQKIGQLLIETDWLKKN